MVFPDSSTLAQPDSGEAEGPLRIYLYSQLTSMSSDPPPMPKANSNDPKNSYCKWHVVEDKNVGLDVRPLALKGSIRDSGS